MNVRATRLFVIAAFGLAAAAGLSFVVSSATGESAVLANESPDAGLELVPGRSGIKEVRTPEDKPVVVNVSAGGKAVVQSNGGPALIPDDSGNAAEYIRKSRSEDD